MKEKIISIGLAYFPVFLWAAIIFLLSSQSVLASLDLSVADFIFKKSAHIFVYAVLFFLLFRANYLTNQSSSKINWTIVFSICLIYAISDEVHQSLVPGRHAAIRDIAYDSLGMLIAFCRIYHYI